jgi:eukaryotic-like serine/threonine-protein kinase
MGQRPENQSQLKKDVVLGNRYLIQEVVGVGGMGAVYRARDMHFPHIERYLAIKEMINTTLDTEMRKTAIENFEREAHILAALTHPAIPKIFDFFSDEQSSYLVEEYIAGKDLELLLEESKTFLPVDRVTGWAIEICDVLDYLHHHKPEPIIFRDIKPSNVMVNQYGHVVLVDFGIAKVFKSGQKGTMIGTEGYSPPEQYRGEATFYADIYALGASLHHLLTKRDPRLEPPFTFSERPIRQINPEVPVDLEEVIYKALQYNPQNRFQSTQEMKEALRETLKRKITAPSTFPVASVVNAPHEAEKEKSRLLWKFECLDEVRGAVLTNGGIVYFGSYDQFAYALEQKKGELLWKYQAEGAIVGKPAIFEDNIFFGSEDYRLYAVSTNTGRLVWNYPTEGPIRSSPHVSQNHVFLGSDDGYVYAINVVSGKATWKVNLGAPVRSVPFVTDSEVVVGNENGEAMSIDFRGNLRWRFQAKRAITSSPVAEKGVVYFTSLDSMIYAVDLRAGWAVWRFRMGKGSVSSPCIFSNFLFAGSADGYMYCVDVGNGREMWKYQTGHQVSGSAIVYKDLVYFGSVDGFVYCLDHKTGKLKWKYELNGPITGTPSISGDVLYIGSLDHCLYALAI